MITFFNSKSVYLGCDMKKFNEIRDYLDAKGIPYRYKVKNRMTQWNGRGTVRGKVGSAENPPELSYEYEILVHKRDAERVKF